jgi:hypothetical protein
MHRMVKNTNRTGQVWRSHDSFIFLVTDCGESTMLHRQEMIKHPIVFIFISHKYDSNMITLCKKDYFYETENWDTKTLMKRII